MPRPNFNFTAIVRKNVVSVPGAAQWIWDGEVDRDGYDAFEAEAELFEFAEHKDCTGHLPLGAWAYDLVITGLGNAGAAYEDDRRLRQRGGDAFLDNKCVTVFFDVDGDAVDAEIFECQKIDAARLVHCRDACPDLECDAAQAKVLDLGLADLDRRVRFGGWLSRRFAAFDADLCLVNLVSAYLIR